VRRGSLDPLWILAAVTFRCCRLQAPVSRNTHLRIRIQIQILCKWDASGCWTRDPRPRERWTRTKKPAAAIQIEEIRRGGLFGRCRVVIFRLSLHLLWLIPSDEMPLPSHQSPATWCHERPYSCGKDWNSFRYFRNRLRLKTKLLYKLYLREKST